VALGAANYILGCLPAYKRFFLIPLRRIFTETRAVGMQQLGPDGGPAATICARNGEG